MLSQSRKPFQLREILCYSYSELAVLLAIILAIMSLSIPDTFCFMFTKRYFFLFYFHDQGNLIRYMLYIFPFFLPFHLTAFLYSQTLSFSGLHFLVFFPLRPVSPFSHSHSGVSKVMAPNSSTLAWQIPWAEEPGRLQSMGSQRVGHN